MSKELSVLRPVRKLTNTLLTALIVILILTTVARANTRTLETRFALSADARSEFGEQFPLLSAGRILVEANWNPTIAAK